MLECRPIGVSAAVVLLALFAFPVAADSANDPGANVSRIDGPNSIVAPGAVSSP